MNTHSRNAYKEAKKQERRQKIVDLYSRLVPYESHMVAFKCRFCKLMAQCRVLQDQVSTTSTIDLLGDVEDFYRRLLQKCAEWLKLGNDLLSLLLRMPRELKAFEREIKQILDASLGFIISPAVTSAAPEYPAEDWGDILRRLRLALDDISFYRDCCKVQGDDALCIAKVMGQVLRTTDHKDGCRTKAYKILNELCKRDLAAFYTFVPRVTAPRNLEERASGGFGRVSKGNLSDGRTVAVKTITFYSAQDNTKRLKSLRTEILLWSLLEHPNILPLIGITETETYMGISMVAPWCRNGNLSDYSKKQRNAYINRLQQLADIGSALTYLHNHVPTIIHGDLKCANVLVSDDGRPLLCDFGLATLRYNGATMSSALDSGSVRWMAIELISILDKPTINKETDIWAFAMLALELLTGDLPFSDKRNDMAVLSALQAQDERPLQPGWSAVVRGLTNDVWSKLYACWDKDPAKRPKLNELVDLFQEKASVWVSPASIRSDNRPWTMGSVRLNDKVLRRIVTTYAASVKSYESDLLVKIKSEGAEIQIYGPPDNIEEAKSRLQSLAVGKAAAKEKAVQVPRAVIDVSGDKLKRLKDRHGVDILPQRTRSRVVIRGMTKDVVAAEKDILKLADEVAAPTVLRLPARTTKRVALELNRLIRLAKADLRLSDDAGVDGSRKIIIRGTRDAVASAEAEVKKIHAQVSAEAERVLSIRRNLHHLIVGNDWRAWYRIVAACDGPVEPALQRELIEVAEASDKIRLHGSPELLDRLELEIRRVVAAQSREVYGRAIDVRYHAELMKSAAHIKAVSGADVWFPGESGYDQCGEPYGCDNLDRSTVVKIEGTHREYKAAFDELTRLKESLQEREVEIVIRSKYRHAMFRRVRHELQSVGVTITPEPLAEHEYHPKPPTRPNHVYSNGVQWSLVDRFSPQDTNSVTWRVVARDERGTVLAEKVINEAYEFVRNEKSVGFLTVPAPAVPDLLARNEESLRKLERDTKTLVRVLPSTEGAKLLQITGSSQHVIEARDRLLATLFRKSAKKDARVRFEG